MVVISLVDLVLIVLEEPRPSGLEWCLVEQEDESSITALIKCAFLASGKT